MLKTITVGNRVENGEIPQVTIAANTWFAVKIKSESGFSLVSCTVAPGFDFLDFELAKRDELVKQFPDQANIINEFTR